MSTASISYSSLRNAAGEARDVAKKLDKYADSINSSVYKKLNSYDGSWTGNITSARSKASAKISELRTEAGKYRTYADELEDLKTECESVDKTVKSKVSSLTASFKAAHGINNNVVVNTISYIFTSIGNSNATKRWLDTKTDEFDAGINYHKQAIEDWYDYNGGKELIKGVVVAALEIAVGVLSIVAAVASILAGGWTIALAAALIGGCIAVVNGVTNLVNECRGYGYADDDPATAKRKSDMNTIQETLRIETDSEFWHNIATGIDIVNIACTAITVVTGLGKLIKNGYQWFTGKSFELKKLFSMDTLNSIKSKFADIGAAFKQGGLMSFKDFGADVLHNLKNEFWNFSKASGDFDLANTAKSIKNLISVPKDLIDGGLSFKNILKVGVLNIALPALTVFSIESDEVQGFEVGEGGQFTFDFTENITANDFYSSGEKGVKFFKQIGELFKGDGIDVEINLDVINKLNEVSPINVSIPEIKIPKTTMIAA